MHEDMLRGWNEIERYLGLTRNTILARAYPIRKDGGIFAFKSELEEAARRKPFVAVAVQSGAKPGAKPGASGTSR